MSFGEKLKSLFSKGKNINEDFYDELRYDIYDNIEMPHECDYFNAGVVLMNLKALILREVYHILRKRKKSFWLI